MDSSNQPVQLIYAIQVQGKLKEEWSAWFDGMTITFTKDSNLGPLTTLMGAVADQSALRGILTRIWNLNLTLISVARLGHVDEGACNDC